MLSKLIPISILASLVLGMGHPHAGLQLRHVEPESAPAPSLGAYNGDFGYGDKKKHNDADKVDSESGPKPSLSPYGGGYGDDEKKHEGGDKKKPDGGDKKKHDGDDEKDYDDDDEKKHDGDEKDDSESGPTPGKGSHGGKFGGDKKHGEDEDDVTKTSTSTHTATATVYAQKPSAVKEDGEKKPEKPKACKARHGAGAPGAVSPGKEASPVGSSPPGYSPGEDTKVSPEGGSKAPEHDDSSYPEWNGNAPSKPSSAAPKPSPKDESHKPSSGHEKPEHGAKPTFSKKVRPSQSQKPWGAQPSADVPYDNYGNGQGDESSSQGPSPSYPPNEYGPAPSGSEAAAPANSDLALVKPSGTWLQNPDANIQTAAPAPPSDVPVYSAPPQEAASDSVVYEYQTVDVVPVPASSGTPKRRRAMRRF